MTDEPKYSISLDAAYGYLERIDVPEIVRTNEEEWFNQTLTQVDNSVVRLGIIQGEFHWHQHDDEDELFFVLVGELEVDIGGGETVVLGPHQGYNVPKGTQHRTRARSKTSLLMISAADVQPTGG